MTKVYNPLTDKTNDYITHGFFHENPIGRLIFNIKNIHINKILYNAFLNTSLSKLLIKAYIKKNKINIQEYKTNDYLSFNQFNKRLLKRNQRPLSKDIISIADSILLVKKIKSKELDNIKNIINDNKLAEEYKNGLFLLFKINKSDYRHYIFIDDGKIIKQYYKTHDLYFKLKEERYLCDYDRTISILKTKSLGNVITIEFNNFKNYQLSNFKKGQEKGYFLSGSSYIVILIKSDLIEVDKLIVDNSKRGIYTCVQQGSRIGIKK